MYPILFSLGTVSLTTFGLLLLVAFVFGAFVIWKYGREEHFEEDDLLDGILVSTFWGVVGGRLLFVTLQSGDFGWNLGRILALTRFPGLSFLGAMAGGLIALWLFARKKKWETFEALDVYVLGLSLAQVFGWLGAFLNGTGYGTRTNLPWALTFPGVEGARHPTQLYAALWYLLLFVLLRKVFREYRTFQWYTTAQAEAKSGLNFLIYLLGVGIAELGIGVVRPSDWYWQGVALSSLIGMGLVVISLMSMYLRSGRTFQGAWRSIRAARSNAYGMVIHRRERKKGRIDEHVAQSK